MVALNLKGILTAVLIGLGITATELENFSLEREIAIARQYKSPVGINNLDGDAAVKAEMSIFSGDTLRTDSKGYALVIFTDRSTAKVLPNSQLIVRGEIDRNQNANTRIDLYRGGVFLDVNRQGDNQFEVLTTTTVASVKGTRFGARSNGFYWVDEGEVEVMALQSGQLVMLRNGMFAQADESGTDLVTGQLTSDELVQLNVEYDILDQDLIEQRMILRFRDSNGQIVEENIDYYEQENN